MGVTPFNELFTTNENMQTKAEIKEEIVKAQALMPPETDISQDDAIADMEEQAQTVGYIWGYMDALKWALREKTGSIGSIK